VERVLSGTFDRAAIEDMLGIGKTTFLAILTRYRHDPNPAVAGTKQRVDEAPNLKHQITDNTQ